MALALEHERRVTADIYALHEIAQKERDYASHVLLEWFAAEQVEEEKTLEEVLDHVRMVGDDGAGLLILDERMGARTTAAVEAGFLGVGPVDPGRRSHQACRRRSSEAAKSTMTWGLAL